MRQNTLNKKLILSLVTVVILFSVSPISVRAVEEDPDQCLSPQDAATIAADRAAGVALVPVSADSVSSKLVGQKRILCQTKNATKAVKDKTVGKTIFGITIPGAITSWDGIAKIAMKAVIKKLTDDTVKWINSGANGSPMFVTDPGQYFTNVANGLADDFILGTNSPLNFLCTPFAQNIRISLATNYATRQSYNPQCTFTGIGGFLKDGFNRGGWQDWFSLTQNSQNNPYESYLNAQVELDSRIASALKIKQDQLNWGSGFLSTEKCDEKTGKCHIVTPGSVVGPQLNKVLGLGADDLTLARSFDDVVSALVGALSRKVFSNAGLLGGGGSSYSGDNTDGIETGAGLTPGPQDFGPGVDPTLGITCSADRSSALFNEPVTWTATTVEAEGISYSYEWINVTDLPAGSTDSVLTMNYTTEGNKIASVKITSTRANDVSGIPTVRTSTINCSPGVMVAQYAPLVINSCAPSSGESIANEISPFEIDTTGERRIRMARVTWVANISGGSGVLATNKPIVWSGESRDEFRHIIQIREFGKKTKEKDVPMWEPYYTWSGGTSGHYDYVGGSNGTTQTITKNADGSTTITISRLYEILNKETTRDVSARIEVRDANVFIENNGRAGRDCKPAVFLYKP